MGYYIQVPENKGKAQQLVMLHDATILKQCPATFEDVPEGKALICVVDNGPFEAAALCYSARELEEFDALNDIRPRTWLLMDQALAHQLAGFS